MIKILRFYLFVASLLMLSSLGAYAQNCSVNAGVNTTICPGDEFKLLGEFSGLISSNATWTQISGPSVNVSATTIAGTKATAIVTGYAPDVNYVFRISAKCTDGSLVYQDVTYVVSSLGTANAGTDGFACPGTPYALQGSPLGVGEIGKWTITGGGTGPTIANDANPNTTVTFPTRASTQNYTFTWTVSKTTGGSTCTSTDNVVVTNMGTAAVNAGADINRSCYNVTTSAQLNGSFAGTNTTYGQSALWTFVSGPSTPTISNATIRNPNVTNLVQGTYVFRYTVTGPCLNGSDEVSVIVAAASQNITNAGGGGTQTYCDNRTTVLLTGPKALYNGETMQWTGGPVGSVITNPTSNSTTVTGLSGVNGTSADFTYTITNPATGCNSSGTYTVEFKAPPTIAISNISPVLIACGTTQVAINYAVTAGTGTEYALISAPAGSGRQSQMGGLNNYTGAPNSGTMLTGFDKIGTYVIRYRRNTDSGSGGCADAYTDVTIVASNAPTAANAGTDQVLACNVFSTALAGNVPLVGTGKWSQVSGPNVAVIANPLLNNTGISGLISGKYTFRWIISGGEGACVNEQRDVDVIVSSQTPTASVVGTNINACNSTPVYLTGNTPGLNETGTWTVTRAGNPAPEVVFSSVSSPNAVATGLASNSTYTFTWTITNNCSVDFPASVVPASYTVTTSNIAGPKQAQAGADRCVTSGTNTFNLSGNAPTGTETGTWTKISGPAITFADATLYNTAVNGVTNGTYVFQWTLSNNACTPTTDQVTITVSAPATAATAGVDQNICGNSVTLAGNTPTIGIGTWTQTEGAGGAIITDINNPTTTVTGLTDGRYKFTWTISNGACASSTPDEVTINVSSPSSVAVAGSDQAICNATTATLAATPLSDGTGSWVAVSGPSVPVFADASNPATTVSGLKYGVYVLRWTSRGGIFCPVTQDDVQITVTQNANAGADRALCGASSVTLTGNENSTGTWSYVSGPAGYTLTSTGPNSSVVTNLVAGVYKFKYELPAVGTCVATEDEIQITIEAAPSAAVAGNDQEICQPTATATSTMTMTATPPAVGTGTWVLLDSSLGMASPNNPTITNANLATTTITGMQAGVYLYEWRVENTGGACADNNANADIVRLTVFKEPSAAVAGNDQLSACSNKVKMTATAPSVGLGTWSVITAAPGSTVAFDAVNSPTSNVSGLVDGNYTFRWTVSNGSPTCTSKFDEVNITVTTAPVTVANAGVDKSVCTTAFPGTASFVLEGNAPAGTEDGTWTIVSQPAGSAATFTDLNVNNTTISGLKPAAGAAEGEYILRWTIKNKLNATPTDCDSFDEVTIKVYNIPSASVAGTNQTVCTTSPVTLSATAVAPERGIGTWSNKAGNPTSAVFSNVNAPNASLSGLVAGTYNLIWTVSNGTCTASTSEVQVVVSNCEIAIAKSTSTPVQQADGSFNITLTFKVQNTGDAALTGVQVEDNLALTFPSPKTWTVTSVSSTGTLVANAGFNGSSNQQLITNASTLAVGTTETITLVLNVRLN